MGLPDYPVEELVEQNGTASNGSTNAPYVGFENGEILLGRQLGIRSADGGNNCFGLTGIHSGIFKLLDRGMGVESDRWSRCSLRKIGYQFLCDLFFDLWTVLNQNVARDVADCQSTVLSNLPNRSGQDVHESAY